MLIQTTDNDMTCPAHAADYASYRSKLISVLQALAHGLRAAVHRAKYHTEDLNHLSVAGHAWAARVAWTAMRHTGVVP